MKFGHLSCWQSCYAGGYDHASADRDRLAFVARCPAGLCALLRFSLVAFCAPVERALADFGGITCIVETGSGRLLALDVGSAHHDLAVSSHMDGQREPVFRCHALAITPTIEGGKVAVIDMMRNTDKLRHMH
eukprot:TRINITY_DN31759_c0_g1_i2.p1 TRINITY_DN31759_c0_g1~~TRINITY_DN31759_c0_g1_i2.p1  ORF type:complete len:132 (+),score=18.07 TRINITY_DN31759_c0_g1_i2:220-615(+)